MTYNDFLQLLYDKSFQAGMNQQYYQTLATEYGDKDSRIKIAVALMALVALLVTIYETKLAKVLPPAPPAPDKTKDKQTIWDLVGDSLRQGWAVIWSVLTSSLSWAIVSVAVAIWLNVSSAGDLAKQNQEFYQEWTEIRAEVDSLDLLARNKLKTETVESCVMDRFNDVIQHIARIEAREPAPNVELVEKCLGDESERRWGKGVRTLEEREKKAREKQSALNDSQQAIR